MKGGALEKATTMNTIVYFDLETGGLNLEHPIIQLAAVAMVNGEQVAEFEAKLKFNPNICDGDALKLNGYYSELPGALSTYVTCNAAWNNAELPATVCKRFAQFLEPFKNIEKISKAGKPYKVAQLAGYNSAVFDMPRLQKLFSDNQIFLPADWKTLDVFQLAIWYFHLNPEGKPESLKLSSLCQHFGISLENAHDALADVKATIAVTEKLLSKPESSKS